MINATHVGISAQMALERRLATIANNVANASTAGFRSELVRFTTTRSQDALPDTGYASIGATYLNRAAGEIVQTGSPLDIAIDGDAWLAVATPQGIAYSRDGRLQISAAGELRTMTGHSVLDPGGSAIRLDPAGEPPSIARDGTIAQGNLRIGSIGLFGIEPDARLSRGLDATVIPDKAAQPLLDQPLIGVRQGFIERSNVNAIVEMSRLIANQRLFEAITGAIGDMEQLKSDAIRSLGSPS